LQTTTGAGSWGWPTRSRCSPSLRRTLRRRTWRCSQLTTATSSTAAGRTSGARSWPRASCLLVLAGAVGW